MEKTLFQEYPERQRLEMLDSNADGIETMDYTEYLTPEELAENKAVFAQKCIEEARILDRKKEFVDNIKVELEPITKEKSVLLNEIKFGSRSKNGKCYKMVDHENHEVGYYNDRGQLVYSRPAKPEESQRVLKLQKTGTEN